MSSNTVTFTMDLGTQQETIDRILREMDLTVWREEIHRAIGQHLHEYIQQTVKAMFSETISREIDAQGRHVWKRIKGEGVQQAETIIKSHISSPTFEHTVLEFIQDHWKLYFEQAMKAALMHKAKGFAFNKIPQYQDEMRDLVVSFALKSDGDGAD